MWGWDVKVLGFGAEDAGIWVRGAAGLGLFWASGPGSDV